MGRGLAMLRVAAAPVVVTAQVVGRVGMAMIARQERQPSLGAEARAFVRQGREDFLATVMGPLAGQTREVGAPGSPTAHQTTAALEGRRVRHVERG